MKAGNSARVRKEVLLFGTDLIACSLCVWLALRMRFGNAIPVSHRLAYEGFLPVLIGFWVLSARLFGLYDFKHRLTAMDHVFSGCGAALLGVGASYVFLALVRLYYTHWIDVSRAVAVFDALLLAVWFGVSRTVVLLILARWGYRVRALLVGPEEVCRGLADEFRDHAPRLLELAGIVSSDGGDGAGVVGEAGELERLLAEFRPDQAILTGLTGPQDQLQDLLAQCDKGGVEVFVHPDLTLSVLASANVTSIAGIPLVCLSPGVSAGPYQLGKRALDLAASSLGLVLAVPLGVAAGVAIRVTSPGPALFSQERVGLQGRVFRVYKFRTMKVDAEVGTGPVLATNEDPRVTRLGRMLRRFRVDEIPQLWNVLKGEMSLVGPRPERPEFTGRFAAENPLYERRLLVKPGLTGLAQIHGRYDSDYTHKLRYDLIYVNSMSLATDLRILAATVRIVLTGKGAV